MLYMARSSRLVGRDIRVARRVSSVTLGVSSEMLCLSDSKVEVRGRVMTGGDCSDMPRGRHCQWLTMPLSKWAPGGVALLRHR